MSKSEKNKEDEESEEEIEDEEENSDDEEPEEETNEDESELEEVVEESDSENEEGEEDFSDQRFLNFMGASRRRGPTIEGVGTFMDEPVFVNLERGMANIPKAGNGNGEASPHKVKYDGFQEEYSSSGQKKYERGFENDYKFEPGSRDLPEDKTSERKNLPFEKKADYEPRKQTQS